MRKLSILYLIFFLGLFYTRDVDAATIYAANSGNWSTASTWSLGVVPGPSDDVVIDGYEVTINGLTNTDAGSLDIKSLQLLNASNSIAALYIESNVVFTINGDLTLTSSVVSKTVSLQASGASCVIQVNGDIKMEALNAGEVFIDLSGGSGLSLTGNFSRPDKFGTLIMTSGCTLTFNGTGIQNLANENILGSGTDAFTMTNIAVNNPNGITLTEPLYIRNNLNLTNGIIVSSNANPVIVGDNATITGGSSSAYINGPVVKEGRTNGVPFTFPIGNASVYAPMTISRVITLASEYTVTYKGDPPPFGNNAASVSSVDPTQYWEMSKAVGSDDVSINLSWNDAAASGLTNLSTVIVVGLNETTSTWENYGQQSVSGGVGSGVSGAVSSLDGDPPPFGILKFTVGSGVATGGLPVELSRFFANQNEDEIYLEWRTASESNTDHYVVERSIDGNSFEYIQKVKTNGDSESQQVYSAKDFAPYYGMNYYRLKIMDNDGTFEYSPVEAVDFSAIAIMSIIPNPVKDALFIKGEIQGENETILEVFDRSGKRLYRGKANFENGSFRTTTDEVNVTSPGTYFLRITGSGSSNVIKFIKLN